MEVVLLYPMLMVQVHINQVLPEAIFTNCIWYTYMVMVKG